MSQEEKAKLELPPGWKRINFYSLNLAYCFAVLFASLQIGTVKNILIKLFVIMGSGKHKTAAFGQQMYDVINGWVLLLLLITAAGTGVIGYVRMLSVKKIINILESDDKKPD